MSLKIPAVAAGILLAGTIGISSAHAASGFIQPVADSHGLGKAIVAVGLRHDEDCRFRMAADVADTTPGGRVLPIWHTKDYLFNACAAANVTWYEDGSMIDHLVLRFPTLRLQHGRAVVRIAITTRKWGGTWSNHVFVRTFWH